MKAYVLIVVFVALLNSSHGKKYRTIDFGCDDPCKSCISHLDGTKGLIKHAASEPKVKQALRTTSCGKSCFTKLCANFDNAYAKLKKGTASEEICTSVGLCQK
ncbi:hypothetical protein TELCIR_02951 [Teladorsagia circumcincta]|uniref:Surfactant protein B n=1 Tax=Teladorsagia circumcincta TaxID=45464 RepID=A0A2G9UXP6_TELCI|nr:hypothetical protein TELCIR_02951 [Teladorsagia circumcincta]